MATIPTPELIKQMQAQTQKSIEEKTAEQAKQGKDFIINPGGHAPGVIPEEDWQKQKSLDAPEIK